jgi:hypothetical protein
MTGQKMLIDKLRLLVLRQTFRASDPCRVAHYNNIHLQVIEHGDSHYIQP